MPGISFNYRFVKLLGSHLFAAAINLIIPFTAQVLFLWKVSHQSVFIFRNSAVLGVFWPILRVVADSVSFGLRIRFGHPSAVAAAAAFPVQLGLSPVFLYL